jgi:AAA15 family ATPase/GTPase
MLHNIQIQNFRCFEDFKAEGFERINLIGGKNNSGKTCLLEGISLLGLNSLDVSRTRNQSREDSFFDKSKEIQISTAFSKDRFVKKILLEQYEGVTWQFEAEEFNPQNGFHGMDFQLIKQKNTAPYINLITLFDTIDENKLTNELVNALKFVDSSIDGVRTFASYPNSLYVSQVNKIWQKLRNYGDAVEHLIGYFSFLLNLKIHRNERLTVLCIDEIENGIHYTAHEEFWQKMFQLAKELNVQIFATTHSLEMIQAFNKVALAFEKENPEHKGAYFEMIRNEETNAITALKHEANVLAEELGTEMKFRGELYKEKIELSQDMIDTLQLSLNKAKQNAKDKNIALPFIREGKLFQLNPDGTETLIKELENN